MDLFVRSSLDSSQAQAGSDGVERIVDQQRSTMSSVTQKSTAASPAAPQFQ